MGFIQWLIALVAAAIGAIIAYFIIDEVGSGNPDLLLALIWFLIAFTLYFAGRKLEEEEWFKLVSANFFITWAFCTVGYLVGYIIWILIDTGSVSVDLDNMIDIFFNILPLTIGPTAAMSLGLRD